MRKAILSIFLAVFLSGCIYLNDRGVSTQYYNSCKEYYDATGAYKKQCDHNIIDWESKDD